MNELEHRQNDDKENHDQKLNEQNNETKHDPDIMPRPLEGTSLRCKLESEMRSQGALEEDEEQAEGDTKKKMTVGATREEMMVGATREEMMVEDARVETGGDRDDPELRKYESLQQN